MDYVLKVSWTELSESKVLHKSHTSVPHFSKDCDPKPILLWIPSWLHTEMLPRFTSTLNLHDHLQFKHIVNALLVV